MNDPRIDTPDYLLDESPPDDPDKFPLTYHAKHHRGMVITQCDDEHCKAYVRSMTS